MAASREACELSQDRLESLMTETSSENLFQGLKCE